MYMKKSEVVTQVQSATSTFTWALVHLQISTGKFFKDHKLFLPHGFVQFCCL